MAARIWAIRESEEELKEEPKEEEEELEEEDDDEEELEEVDEKNWTALLISVCHISWGERVKDEDENT